MSSLGGRDALAGKTPIEMADNTIEMFERKATAAGRYSPEVRRQATEAAQMLRDLKTNDPAAFEAFGKGMQSGGNNKAYYGLSIGLEGYGFDKPTTPGGPATANPDALKTTLSMIIQNPDNALNTVNSRYTKEHPKFYVAEAKADPASANVAPAAVAAAPIEAAVAPVQTYSASVSSSGGSEPVRRREASRPPVQAIPAQAMPAEQANTPYASPGMAIYARSAMEARSRGNEGASAGVSGAAGFSGFAGSSGLFNVLRELMQRIANVVSESPLVTTLGNDGSSLTKMLAGMTGTNPRVMEMSPNGQERDLGRARDIGQQQVIPETRIDPAMNMRGM